MIAEIYVVNIKNNIDDFMCKKLLAYLDQEKRDKIKKYRKPEDAHRALIGALLTRYMLQKSSGCRNEEMSFRYNPYGKPILEYPASSLHFNISHSGSWVVGVVHQAEAGIDVEKIRRIDFKLAERFFSNQEYRDLLERAPSERLSYFYDLWTLKESYIKAVGKGLSLPLHSFSVAVQEDNISFMNHRGLSEDKERFQFRQYELGHDYKLAVCLKEGDFPATIVSMSSDEFLASFLQLQDK
ncbi:4'-phosphopantetheinyl transferase [Evansella caseinilytica]|uniref:4'-phosphopantetheinyl transferase n=1 Tax=Evansella caseinilytica TaxID=1503961 RepID=A0A1H3SWQ2_9BACI|nr:4'-phosphopantetheinyl transferase superfamily protein [Evansella caseinilytica]SDZ42354.1 4'-phosphopantetheinyl transferase [Evansella caseinilytica]